MKNFLIYIALTNILAFNSFPMQQASKQQKQFVCEFEGCGKSFNKPDTLRIHKNKHYKYYVCEICQKSCSCPSELEIHKRKHTGDKTFKCDQCEKTYAQKSDLMEHKRIHTGETFQCDTCNKAFVKKSDLVKHIRIHTGERPYKCDQCDKAFTQSQHLTSHKKTHLNKSIAAAAAVAASMQANLEQAQATQAAAAISEQDMAVQHAGASRKANNEPKGQRASKRQKTAAVQRQTEEQLVASAPIAPSMEYMQQVSEQIAEQEFDLDKWFEQQEAQDAQKSQQAPATAQAVAQEMTDLEVDVLREDI